MIDPNSFQSCRDLFREYGIELDIKKYQMLRIYEQMLTEESARQNVTAVHDPEQIWIRHFLDSAMLLQYLTDGSEVLDMGTGGGIPGIPLAIMNSSLHITLLDSELKKIEFCRKVISALELETQSIYGRAEELARSAQYRETFDYVVSRAMANGSMLTELSAGFLKVNGCLYAMKGKMYDPAVERFEAAAGILNCYTDTPLSYSVCGEPKFLIAVHKIGETPEQYPRRYAKLKRSPL